MSVVLCGMTISLQHMFSSGFLYLHFETPAGLEGTFNSKFTTTENLIPVPGHLRTIGVLQYLDYTQTPSCVIVA